MPHAAEYLSGYGFVVGNTWGQWYITNVSAGHKVVKLFNEYAYPTILQLTYPQNITEKERTQALQMVTAVLAHPRIIRSDSGRPYECTATNVRETANGLNFVEIAYDGYGKRVKEERARQVINAAKAVGLS